MHVLNTKPKENSLVYVYFLFWITFKFILLPSAVSFRYYPINDYGCNHTAIKKMSWSKDISFDEFFERMRMPPSFKNRETKKIIAMNMEKTLPFITFLK